MRVQKSFSAFTLAEGATHVANSNNVRMNAFTLAEVLITLGIIGVVAAMTMPTLINQTNGAQYKAAYKKALSAISQAVTLNVALDDVSFADATTKADSETPAATSIAGFLQQRMNVVKTILDKATYKVQLAKTGGGLDDLADFGSGNVTLFFNDSSVFSYDKDTVACTEKAKCRGLIDVNGQKGPNKEVTADAVTDIYPVVFYDQTILPATDAAKAVLYGK